MKNMKIGKQGKAPVKLRRPTSLMQKVGFVVRIVILIGLIIWLVWSQNNQVFNTEYLYISSRVPKSFVGYKISHVSDLVNSSIDAAGAVKKADPDIIIISGQLSDTDGNNSESLSTIKNLLKIAPCYILYEPEDIENGTADTVDDYYGNDLFVLNDRAFSLDAPELNIDAFINKYIGKVIVNKADAGDELSAKYVEYTRKTLEETKNSTFLLSGASFDVEPDGLIKNMYDIIGTDKSILQICVANQVGLYKTLSDVDIDVIFSGGTFGTNGISKVYSKGAYTQSGTNLFLSGGLGLNPDYGKRFFNFPEIQTVILSDGTIKNDTPLEKFLGMFISDVSSKFGSDEGFTIYVQEFGNEYDFNHND